MITEAADVSLFITRLLSNKGNFIDRRFTSKKKKKRLASSCEMLPPGRFGPDADVRDKMAASRVGRRFRPLDLEVDLTNTSRSTFARQRNPDLSVCLLSD